eukprot:TRINITY_DN43125_c0_g1_i1.p1 TRINITY_DN43125_c0_g1~~TRINITY_DN43125_c0_g1_i1.p1  ORF type:complete len:264 (-),score=47.96 TRINITY_DN43125_c0_g1_i1:376-1077(-)
MASNSSAVFLAVARVSDGAVLALRFGTANSKERADLDAGLKRMIKDASKLAYPGWRSRNGGPGEGAPSLFGLLDEQAMCLVALGVQGMYPERVAHQCLGELAASAQHLVGPARLEEARPGELGPLLREPLRSLLSKYGNPGKIDKVSDVHQKVDELKGVMQDKVRKIVETHASLEALELRSKSMSESATQFLKQSVGLKRQLQLRNLKIQVITGCCVLAIVGYISLPVLSVLS